MKKPGIINVFVMLIVFFILVALLFSFPTIRFQWTTRKWEAQIKQKQDPEILRAWAKELMKRYQNDPFNNESIQTNMPPVEAGIHHEFTSIYYAEAETNGHAKLNPDKDYVNVDCDFGAWTGVWGLKIGETNFVSLNPKDSEWKPGIYFFRFGGD